MSDQSLTNMRSRQFSITEAAPRSGAIGLGIAQRGKRGLLELLHACEYAKELDRCVWEFAVEITALHKLGLTNSDLRWLICKGYVAHGRELIPDGHESRIVRQNNKLKFSRKSCFVASDAGIGFISQMLEQQQSAHLRENPSNVNVRLTTRGWCRISSADADSNEVDLTNRKADWGVPIWDRDRQQLRLGTQVIKQFKVPAPNQERILSAFQEDGWPIRIDDPLPPQMDQDSKRRLHDTINSLNRCHKVTLIHFLGDGKGIGVRWEFVQP